MISYMIKVIDKFLGIKFHITSILNQYDIRKRMRQNIKFYVRIILEHLYDVS